MAVDFKEKHFKNSDMNLKLEDHWSCIAHLTPIGGNSRTESARTIVLIPDTPTQCPHHIGEVS